MTLREAIHIGVPSVAFSGLVVLFKHPAWWEVVQDDGGVNWLPIITVIALMATLYRLMRPLHESRD